MESVKRRFLTPCLPDNAQPDAYGAAQLFPKATVMFRWMQQMHKAEEARP